MNIISNIWKIICKQFNRTVLKLKKLKQRINLATEEKGCWRETADVSYFLAIKWTFLSGKFPGLSLQ